MKHFELRIESFDGDYRFLSNFYPSPIQWIGRTFPTVEHAFQASKTFDNDSVDRISQAGTPGLAKRLGRQVILRGDWEAVKVSTMLELLRIKFQDPELRQKLIDTGDAKLIEGNHWGDSFWGVYNGRGENHLGKLLMQVRDEIG